MALSAPLLVVYRALGLGDLLTAVPALRALARAFPEHRRVLAAPAALAPLAALTETVHEVVASWGGRTVLVPYVQGRSTTRLIEEAVARAG